MVKIIKVGGETKRKNLRPRPALGASPGGFSLVEVMITMVVVGIALLGVAQLVPLGMRRVNESAVRGNAPTVLRAKVDQLETLRFSSGLLSAGNHSETQNQYTLSWKIVDDYPVTGSKRVDVKVIWTDPGAQPDSFQVTTYLVDKP